MRATAGVVDNFFDAYNAHDVNRMADCCTEAATVHYTPVEMWGRQRAVRGHGHVQTIGKVFWTGLIESFPDLETRIDYMTEDDSGSVVAEVMFTGTQAKSWGNISMTGRRYALPHLFWFDVDDTGLISRITAYWDTADHCRQLGYNEVD